MRPLLSLLLVLTVTLAEYKPTWDSLDTRPLPNWYDEVKLGIFCHWGVWSVPAYKSEWFWWAWKGDKPDKNVVDYVNNYYGPDIAYADFASKFKAELFDPKAFVEVVQSSGAKYFVFTSKHAEGFPMWPTEYSWNWNSADVGPRRDVVGELKEAFSKTDIHFGLYYCLFEWFNQLYLKDIKHNTTEYVEKVTYLQMMEIVNNYKPDIFWSDGEWMWTSEHWRSQEFVAWLYNKSPIKDTVIVNDRWGADATGKHGGYLTFHDNFDPGYLLERKWENCLTVDKWSWGHRRNIKMNELRTVHELIVQLARTISCGGNMLLNIGPDMHGRIPLIFQQRLKEFGDFVRAVDEAIYTTKPWVYQNDTGNVWYTSRYRNGSQDGKVYLNQYEDDTIVYAWILDVSGGNIALPRVKPTDKTKVTFLGTNFTYNPKEITDIFIIPETKIPWRTLPRKDVIVVKIEYAHTFHRISHNSHKKHHHVHRKHMSKESATNRTRNYMTRYFNTL